MHRSAGVMHVSLMSLALALHQWHHVGLRNGVISVIA